MKQLSTSSGRRTATELVTARILLQRRRGSGLGCAEWGDVELIARLPAGGKRRRGTALLGGRAQRMRHPVSIPRPREVEHGPCMASRMLGDTGMPSTPNHIEQARARMPIAPGWWHLRVRAEE